MGEDLMHTLGVPYLQGQPAYIQALQESALVYAIESRCPVQMPMLQHHY